MTRRYDTLLEKLFNAVINDDLDYVQRAFARYRFHPDARDCDFNTPLLLAAYHGHISMAEWLITKGARVDEGNQLGITPIMAACSTGNVQMLHFLVKNGGTLKMSDLGNTPLGFACAGGHLEVVKYLVSVGHDLNPNSAFICPSHLMLAAMNGHDEILIYFFLPSLRASDRLNQLPEEARHNVNLLLEKAEQNVPLVDIDAPTPMFFNINLLTFIVVLHKRRMCELMLELGANLNYRLESGNTVANIAKHYGFPLNLTHLTTEGRKNSNSSESGCSSTEMSTSKHSSNASRTSLNKSSGSFKHFKTFVTKLFRTHKS